MAKGNDVAVPVTSREKITAAIEKMQRDASDVSEKIMANILDAETVDDVFAQTTGEAASLIPMESRYGFPLRITNVSLNRSTFAEGPAAYAVIDAVNLWSNEEETIGCGASNVVAGLIKLYELGALPIDVVFYESPKTTANGYHVIQMRKATAKDLDNPL